MKAGAFAVIFDDHDRVLLCHRRDIDAWNLPGGGVEQGETPWDATVREVREEVGVDAEVVRLTGLYWKPGSDELVRAPTPFLKSQSGRGIRDLLRARAP